jgi:hypothetical protein
MDMHIAAVLLRMICELLILAAIGAGTVFGVVYGARWAWSLRTRSRGELVRIAGYAALGPITGPLAARAVGHARGGKPWLAAAWALMIPLVWAGVAGAATLIVHVVAR